MEAGMQGSGIRNFWRRASLAAAAALTLAATAQDAQAADKVTLGALRFTSHAGGFIAYEKGYFKDAGLDVEFKFFQAAQPMAVAIASGDVDFGVTAITGGLINLAEKGAVKVIGGVLQEARDIDGSAILASDAAFKAGLTTPAKLAGRSLGITQTGSSFHYMAAQVAAKEGFGIDQVSMKPLQKVGAIIGALKSGQVDSMIIVPHIAKPLAKSGAAHIIGWINAYDDYQVTTAFTSTKNAKERADLVKRFLTAYARGIADFNAVMLAKQKDPAAVEAMTKLIHKYVYAERPYEKAAPSIQNGAMLLNPDLKLNLTNVKKQLAWFQAEGLVKNSVTIDMLVDTSFVASY
jgi:NitT/TauT family transport system substrate-binding protein